MKVSKQFLRDFAYLANLYGWNAADIEEVKAQTRASPVEMGAYWVRLAAAHRAGYQQAKGNNFVRLQCWEQVQVAAAGAFSDQYARARETLSPGAPPEYGSAHA